MVGDIARISGNDVSAWRTRHAHGDGIVANITRQRASRSTPRETSFGLFTFFFFVTHRARRHLCRPHHLHASRKSRAREYAGAHHMPRNEGHAAKRQNIKR